MRGGAGVGFCAPRARIAEYACSGARRLLGRADLATESLAAVLHHPARAHHQLFGDQDLGLVCHRLRRDVVVGHGDADPIGAAGDVIERSDVE